MSKSVNILPASDEFHALISKFLQENGLHFENRVSNPFEVISTDPITGASGHILSEEDLTAYIAVHSDLPILTNRHLCPQSSLLVRCAKLGFQVLPGGYIPVLEYGPGIILAHYDPFLPLPACFHIENIQVVLCTYSAYEKLRENWQDYSNPESPGEVGREPLPPTPSEWAEWQIANNPVSEEGMRILENIRISASFAEAPEWENWFTHKTKGEHCYPVVLSDFPQQSKRIHLATLKGLETVLLFETAKLIQLGYVLNWDLFSKFESLVEQLRRQDLTVQTIQILAGEYSRFIEEQVNRNIQISRYIRPEDTIDDTVRDEIDPTQFTEDTISETDVQIKKMAEAVIFAAYKRSASDILIEPQTTDYRIRLTIDGFNVILQAGVPRSYGMALVAHLKIRAGMSITERRLPQDGKLTLHIKGSPVELRAATMPVRDGVPTQEEKLTLRLLSSTTRFPNLDRLGMPKDHLHRIRQALLMQNGIIIVTGPTGSGKTTTLYSAVQELDRDRLNIVSLEDPIETFISGISQTQMNEVIGLNFAAALRSTLRQAPHVVLLGEIRDKEVALIAVQAANTGHLVLTTLHTNSAIGTFDRLSALGVESHSIADAVRLIMAQRLIARICPVCRKSKRTTEIDYSRIQKQVGMDLAEVIYSANNSGCRNCHKGYIGRKILTEVIPIDAEIRQMITRGHQHSNILDHAKRHFGYKPLMTQAIEMVNEGFVDLRDAQKLFLDFYADQ